MAVRDGGVAARRIRRCAPRRGLGIAMLLAGVVLLGYVGWQYYGTSWLSHRKHAEIAHALEEGWAQGDEVRETSDGTARALIRIPRFGADYAVPVLDGTSDEALAAGYGHFTESADPGQVGNFAVAAHRVTHGEPLRRMPDLRLGDEIVVETADSVFTYALTTDGEALVVPFTADWVVDPLPTNPARGGPEPPQDPKGRLLTLTTCSELFHTDERMIAFGVLVDIAPKGG